KIAAVRAAIEAAGAQLFLLPPYSPDMNPIEMVFAKLKTLLRQAPERTATGSGDASVRFSTSSLQRSAPTTSKPPAMATHCENALDEPAPNLEGARFLVWLRYPRPGQDDALDAVDRIVVVAPFASMGHASPGRPMASPHSTQQ